MTHNQRGRLTVDLGGNWRWYANLLPAGCQCLGTVTTANGETGALLFTASRVYVRLNAGAMVSLPQAKVQAAVDAARAGTHGGPGRGQGAKAADGATGLKRVNVSLDDASIAAAKALGGGEVSLGIRRALSHHKPI